MTPAALLTEARRRGVVLLLDGETIRYRAPAGALDPALRQALAERKAEIVQALRQEAALAPAHRALEEAVEAIARRWNALTADLRPDLDPAEDLRLEEELNTAFRAHAPEAALHAVRSWRETWEAVLPPESLRSVERIS